MSTHKSLFTWLQGSDFLESFCQGNLHGQVCMQGRREGGQLGHFSWAPKRSTYFNRTVKYSIKAVTTYILPWAPQALSAALCACGPHMSACAHVSECVCACMRVLKYACVCVCVCVCMCVCV